MNHRLREARASDRNAHPRNHYPPFIRTLCLCYHTLHYPTNNSWLIHGLCKYLGIQLVLCDIKLNPLQPYLMFVSHLCMPLELPISHPWSAPPAIDIVVDGGVIPAPAQLLHRSPRGLDEEGRERERKRAPD